MYSRRRPETHIHNQYGLFQNKKISQRVVNIHSKGKRIRLGVSLTEGETKKKKRKCDVFIPEGIRFRKGFSSIQWENTLRKHGTIQEYDTSHR